MDVLKLIKSVREKKPLWDPRDKRYNILEHKKLWAQVAEEMGTGEARVRSRWKNLRDCFRRALVRSRKRGPEYQTPWRFYTELMFLAEVFDYKAPEENADDFNSSSEEQEMVQDSQLTEFVEPVFKDLPIHFERPMKEETYSKNNQTLLERGQSQLMESSDVKGDSDHQFLLSLLPFLNKIPDNRKLAVRIKIQQILLEEQDLN